MVEVRFRVKVFAGDEFVTVIVGLVTQSNFQGSFDEVNKVFVLQMKSQKG